MGTREAETIGLIAGRIPGVIERAAARAIDEVPGYADMPATDVSDGIARDLALAVGALTEGRDLSESDRESMGIIGHTRAQQGLPLEAMLQVYWITVDEVFSELWSTLEQGDLTAEQVFEVARSAWRLVGPMIEVAVRAYYSEQLELAVADSQRLSALVHTLLHTPTDGESSDVAGLGLDPRGEYMAFRAQRIDGDTRRLLLDLKLPDALDNGLVAPHEGDVIGFSASTPRLSESADVILAVGPSGRLHELPRSFTVASRILDTARAYDRTGVFGVEDLALESLARSDSALGDALVDRYVRPLEPGTVSGRECLLTVQALIEHDLSAERAATALFVHPNTVRNRQRRFEQATGTSLRSVTTCAEVHLALLRAQVD
ncbi:MAG: helix-turn-helix domain-containing protein [Solirubrobacterales bacterium]